MKSYNKQKVVTLKLQKFKTEHKLKLNILPSFTPTVGQGLKFSFLFKELPLIINYNCGFK